MPEEVSLNGQVVKCRVCGNACEDNGVAALDHTRVLERNYGRSGVRFETVDVSTSSVVFYCFRHAGEARTTFSRKE